MQFKRNELKYYLSHVSTEGLQNQLAHLLHMDAHADSVEGYRVRSLYFDSINDECLYQKQSGILQRRKFRIRTYGAGDQDTVKFEIKNKHNQLVKKDSVVISRQDADAIISGNYSVMLNYDSAVLNDAYVTFSTKLYRPKVIVEYQRVAFVSPVSNIRITFDKNLRSNINHLDLFSNVQDSMPVILEGKQVLEVKFNDFLPGYLKRILSGYSTERMAISKYTLARRFHKVQKWEDN